MEGNNGPLRHRPFEVLRDRFRPPIEGGSGASEKPDDKKNPESFTFPAEVITEYMEKSKEPEKAWKKAENLEKIINKEISELRKKGKEIISDGYAYNYLESNKNSPLADMLCDYWEEQKKEKEPVAEQVIQAEKSETEEGKKPVVIQPNPAVGVGGVGEKETDSAKKIPPAEKPKFTKEENDKFLEDFNGRFEKGILEKIEGNKETGNEEKSKEFKSEEYKDAIDFINTLKKHRTERIKKGDLTENEINDYRNLFITAGGHEDIALVNTAFDWNKLYGEEKKQVELEKAKANEEIRRLWGAYKRFKIKEEIIKKPEETGEVGKKEEISEKKRVIKEITEEKLEEQLRNVKTREELLDILNSYESFQFNPSEKKKGEYYWFINSPHFDELRKYLKGEINKLDDGYWRDIPLVIRNKVKNIFAAEKKQEESEEKIERGTEKSAEEQLFEQDMKTLKDIALRMMLELNSRLEKENADYKSKNGKERNIFLQGALRGFLQKVIKRYNLPPEESKEKTSQIIEGIINS